MIYTLYLTKQAHKDLQRINELGLKSKVDALLKKVRMDPYCTTPPYEKLVGDLKGAYSRRINIKHRLVYEVNENEKYIKVLRLWTHYE
jgi:toxin YoeB